MSYSKEREAEALEILRTVMDGVIISEENPEEGVDSKAD